MGEDLQTEETVIGVLAARLLHAHLLLRRLLRTPPPLHSIITAHSRTLHPKTLLSPTPSAAHNRAPSNTIGPYAHSRIDQPYLHLPIHAKQRWKGGGRAGAEGVGGRGGRGAVGGGRRWGPYCMCLHYWKSLKSIGALANSLSLPISPRFVEFNPIKIAFLL